MSRIMTDIKFDKLPRQGMVMGYFPSRLVFEKYEIKDGKPCFDNCEILEKEIPSEIHFFDNRTEYRLVRRKSHSDFIEKVLTKEQEDEMEKDLVYPEIVLVKKEFSEKQGFPEKLLIINRYRYSENDTLVLQNYRIALFVEEF